MNKKILTIGSSGIAAILLVMAVVSLDDSIQTQEFELSQPIIPEPTMSTVSESPMTPLPRPIMRLISQPVDDISMGTQISKITVKETALIPKGYEIKGISANSESGTYLMLLSDKEITSSTSQKEFFVNGGIIVTGEDLSHSNVDRADWEERWLEQNDGKRVTINGKSGVMHDIKNHSFADGSLVTNPAKVVFYDENTIYVVKGIVNTTDLIKIAESL